MKHRRRLPLESEICWFLLVCALDVVFTHIALRQSASGMTQVTFVESNPLARWVIENWGLAGMVIFKGSLSLLVVAVAITIRNARPVTAKLLLMGGTVAVAAVVVYSLRLLLQHR